MAFDSEGTSGDLKATPADVVVTGLRASGLADRTLIVWSTEYEAGVLGFNVLCDGKAFGERLNRGLIVGSTAKNAVGVLEAGDSYSFEQTKDSGCESYRLEAVMINGETREFGPVVPEFAVDFQAMPETQKTRGLGSVWSTAQKDIVEFPDLRMSDSFGASFPAESAIGNDPVALKFELRQQGWYRIPAAVMQANGFPMGSPSLWKMYCSGREIAITVTADGSVEFYGTGLDTIQTDRAVYWLTYGSGNGRRNARSSQKYSSSIADGWTRIVAERRDKAMRIASVTNGPRDNWFAAYVSPTDYTTNINVSALAVESNESALIGVDLQGIGSAAHNVAVLLNGTEIGRIVFNDVQRSEWSKAVPLSTLRNGANEIRLRSTASTGDYSLLEAVRISYPRRLTAEGNRLQFALASRKGAKLRGFTSPRVRVFDVTNHDSVTEINPASRLEADGTYSVTVSSASAARLLIAQGDNAPGLMVDSMVRNAPSDLRNLANQANLLLIAPARFHQDLMPLRNARETAGLKTMIVDPIDIYDEFNNGVVSAEAIRSFLQYARTSWAAKPEFAIFVGNASTDPRNYSGSGGSAANVIPTMFADTWNIEAVTDTMIADFDGDSLEDIAIGRLPVRSSAELNALVAKILMHDSMSAEQILNRGATMVSDANSGYNFEAASRNIATGIPASTRVAFTDLATNDPTIVRQNIVNSINAGPAVVNYFGHASVSFWSSRQIYRTADASLLTNYSQPALAVMLSCLSGTFGEPTIDSLAEATIKTPSGGAFGVWAASGWNGAYEEELMGRDFLQRIYSGVPLGVAVRESKSQFSTVDLRRTFIYFGDPSQRLLR